MKKFSRLALAAVLLSGLSWASFGAGGAEAVTYRNCDAVRAAGKAPLYSGQPGYGKHLDRDGDGIACEGKGGTTPPAPVRPVVPAPAPAPNKPVVAPWTPSIPVSAPGTNVYTTPGYHNLNGRLWFTKCEAYSQTRRCETAIWATQGTYSGGQIAMKTQWTFNNLTYLPSPRALWVNNNLARKIEWTEAGRSWKTDCDSAATGRNGCRSYINSRVVEAVANKGGGFTYRLADKWVFNNIVQFQP